MKQTLAPETGDRSLGATLAWLAAEPYRPFFLSGILWSIVGVGLWPLFYAGLLGFAPPLVHARLMIEAFGGAFVVGFLGTAGPRLAGIPPLRPAGLLWLLSLHEASAVTHLAQRPVWGDGLFALLLLSLLLRLGVRQAHSGRETPPPQLLLAWCGLACGILGASWSMTWSVFADPRFFRLAGLLLNQGFLLLPVLGIGSFLFPRLLGGDFGEPAHARERRTRAIFAGVAGALILGSFVLEAWGAILPGYALRLFAAAGYLLREVPWRRTSTLAPAGTLGKGIVWALACGALGLGLAGFFYAQHVSVEHLLYVGGFGLLILIVSSRVIFGHSGDLAGFDAARSGTARWLIGLALLAATTRAAPAWSPRTTVSHHLYAAVTWTVLALLWLLWHRRRLFRRESG